MFEDLALLGGELLERVDLPRASALRRKFFDETARDRGREQRFAGGNHPHAAHQFCSRRVLQEEAARARLQGGVDVLVEIERCQNQHTNRRVGGNDLAGRLDAVHPGHTHIHQHDIGFQRRGLRDRRLAGAGLADNLDVVLRIEQHGEARAHQLLVVHEEHSHHLPDDRGQTVLDQEIAPLLVNLGGCQRIGLRGLGALRWVMYRSCAGRPSARIGPEAEPRALCSPPFGGGCLPR